MFVLGVIVALFLLALWKRQMSFPAQKSEDYELQHPSFDPRRHLRGRFTCDGIVYGLTGRVNSRFAADVDATWTGNTGVLVEHFRYDNGATQDREWHLTLLDGGRIHAEADDMVGPGIGRAAGSALHMLYRIRLPSEMGGYVLEAIDWMYLLENGTIVNRSQFRKFGFKVAELVATFHRRS